MMVKTWCIVSTSLESNYDDEKCRSSGLKSFRTREREGGVEKQNIKNYKIIDHAWWILVTKREGLCESVKKDVAWYEVPLKGYEKSYLLRVI